MSGLIIVPENLTQYEKAVENARDVLCAGSDFEITETLSGPYYMFESHRTDGPVAGVRALSTSRYSIVIAGDVMHKDGFQLKSVLDEFQRCNFKFFASLEGIFAFVIHDRQTNKLHVVSDRRSQKPVFYTKGARGPVVSTNLAVFLRFESRVEFNEQWLWQYLAFNFPIDTSSFLVDVERMPAASVATYDQATNAWSMDQYARQFLPRYPLRSGREELQRTAAVFADVAATCYSPDIESACALTGGWDGRTLLAMAPNASKILAYTYGIPGCDDIVSAKRTARATGIRHRTIEFDSDFIESLPTYALETVYRSGGLQGVLRSTLLYVYKQLTSDGQRIPLTISGISLGTQLRGSAQYPDLVSNSIANRFMGNSTSQLIDNGVLTGNTAIANDFLQSKLDDIESQFGNANEPAHHLLYVVYPASANYFCGELAIADAYSTVRVPAWDSRIIRLNFCSAYSTLALSTFAQRGGGSTHAPLVLQSYLLKHFSKPIFRVPVRGIHPASVLAGSAVYQIERAYRVAHRAVNFGRRRNREPPLENWNNWLFFRHESFVSDLLQSSETRVSEWIDPSRIKHAIESGDVRLVGKLMTIEIILRLVESRWVRFW